MDETRAAPDASPDPAPDLEARLSRQSRALVALAKLEPATGRDPRPAFRRITEVTAETLGVQRASVWLYDEGRTAIRCLDLFEQPPGRHAEGGVLEKDLFPAYFGALDEERTIAAHDVATDERVSEFLDAYLAPLGISSMLDAPVRTEGRLAGVVCCEHVGPPRAWTWDEQNFVGAVGDLVALAMESSERRHAAEQLEGRLGDLARRLAGAARTIADGCAAALGRAEAGPLREDLAQIERAGAELLGIVEDLGRRQA
jgi:GAF domain-containing protein